MAGARLQRVPFEVQTRNPAVLHQPSRLGVKQNGTGVPPGSLEMNVNEFQDLVKKGSLDEVKAALEADRSLATALNASGQSSFILARYYRQNDVASYLL